MKSLCRAPRIVRSLRSFRDPGALGALAWLLSLSCADCSSKNAATDGPTKTEDAGGHTKVAEAGTEDAGPPPTLPLEVLGLDGTTATAPLPTLSADQAAAVSLHLQIHALNYAGKASLQINDGPSIVLANPPTAADAGPSDAGTTITNADVTIDEPGRSYGGIGGGSFTLSLSVAIPSGSLHAGAGNKVVFTFHQTSGFEGGSIGYRVLSLSLVDHAGNIVLAPSFLPLEDPSTWTAPMSDATNIAAGETLWKTAKLQASPLETTHILNAHCTDCHLQDGRDLQYFGFSNHSIVQRAIFHGLSEAQGNQIASFIRTRPIAVVGRPWNPPFQPGPGLDTLPAIQWAAGAGIGAVVTDDSLAVSDQFATVPGPTPVGPTLSINLRQDRVSLLLPDWNHWLPTTHPFDAPPAMSTAFQSATTIESDSGIEFSGSPGPYATYLTIRAGLTGAMASSYTTKTVLNPTVYGWQEPTQYGIDLGTLEKGMEGMVNVFFPRPSTTTTTDGGLPDAGAGEGIPASDSATDLRYSLALWSLVKQFELFLEFDQATLYPGLIGPSAEPRSWHTMSAGDASPHQLGGNEGGQFPVLRTAVRSVYLTTAWDYVQIIVNPGDSAVSRTIPWEYIDGPLFHFDNDYTQQPEGFRALLVALKDLTEHHTGYVVTNNPSGEQCPMPAISCFDPHSDYSLDVLSAPTVMSNLGAAGPALINAGVATWYATMTDPGYPTKWWTTMPSATVACGEWNSTWTRAACSSEQIVPEYVWADLPALRAEGVDSTLLANIAALAQEIWPGPADAPNDWMKQLESGS